MQADKPAPQSQIVYYFEAQVQNVGTRGSITIGMTDKTFLLNRQPGWEPKWVAYLPVAYYVLVFLSARTVIAAKMARNLSPVPVGKLTGPAMVPEISSVVESIT